MIGQGSFALEVDPAIEVSDAAVFNILYFLDVRNSVEHHVAYEYHWKNAAEGWLLNLV